MEQGTPRNKIDDVNQVPQGELTIQNLPLMIKDMKNIREKGGDCYVMTQQFHNAVVRQQESATGQPCIVKDLLGVDIYVCETPLQVMQRSMELRKAGRKPCPIVLGKR